MDSTSLFQQQLNARLDAYFRTQPGGRYANMAMILKIVILLSVWSGTWVLALFGKLPGWAVAVLALIHVFTHLSIILNIAHDAGHGAISRLPWVNRLLTYTFDLVGVSSYLWTRSHNLTHHHHTNALDGDEAIQGYGVIRYTPHAAWRPMFRRQHIYAPLLYAGVSANYVFRKDFLNFYDLLKSVSPAPWGNFVIMLIFRLFYIGYMLVVPLIVMPYPAWQILLGLVVAHGLLGQLIAIIQAGHLHDGTLFPTAAATVKGRHPFFVMHTTVDYAADSRWMETLMGNINLHVIHHLRPGICHIHYRPATRIVKELATEYGLPYRDVGGFWQAYRRHYRLLRQLSAPNAPALAKVAA
jgi:linoleoyl-CoA desaturase